MKVYTKGSKWVHFYYYVDGDTITDNGIIVYDKDGNILENESFYFTLEGQDTILKNKKYSLKIETFTFGKPCFIDSVLMGEFDTKYNFINPDKVIKLYSKTNVVEYSFKPAKQGDNLIMGKLYISNDSTIDGEALKREFIFYKNFYVLE